MKRLFGAMAATALVALATPVLAQMPLTPSRPNPPPPGAASDWVQPPPASAAVAPASPAPASPASAKPASAKPAPAKHVPAAAAGLAPAQSGSTMPAVLSPKKKVTERVRVIRPAQQRSADDSVANDLNRRELEGLRAGE